MDIIRIYEIAKHFFVEIQAFCYNLTNTLRLLYLWIQLHSPYSAMYESLVWMNVWGQIARISIILAKRERLRIAHAAKRNHWHGTLFIIFVIIWIVFNFMI